jgi:hypothetical protein
MVRRDAALSVAAAVYVTCLGVFEGLYFYANGFYARPWAVVRETAGAVAFPLAAGLVVAALRTPGHGRPVSPPPSSAP